MPSKFNRTYTCTCQHEAFFDLVEQALPGPYLELFARRQRLGWDTWGDEALEHVEVRVATCGPKGGLDDR